MNILKEIGRRVDALIDVTMALFARIWCGELRGRPADSCENLGPCVYCGDDVIRTKGVRFDTGAAHTECESATNRDRQNVVAPYRVYADAMRALKALGDDRVSTVVLDVTQRIRPPATGTHLATRLRQIEERVSSDMRVNAPIKDAVKCIARNARNELGAGLSAVN
jgi:histone acetyltransferase (RNA polymerase elongator complex component)